MALRSALAETHADDGHRLAKSLGDHVLDPLDQTIELLSVDPSRFARWSASVPLRWINLYDAASSDAAEPFNCHSVA
jgi:hypothetical protein